MGALKCKYKAPDGIRLLKIHETIDLRCCGPRNFTHVRQERRMRDDFKVNVRRRLEIMRGGAGVNASFSIL